MRSVVQCHFPALRDVPYEITSPQSCNYNCIAWAAGEEGRWWSPNPQYHWPDQSYECSVEAFVKVFQGFSYEVCPSDAFEPGFEKVAIYAKDRVPTHMARQLESGEWTSKCGRLEDITHPLEALEGAEYGQVVVVMKRLRQVASGRASGLRDLAQGGGGRNRWTVTVRWHSARA